MSTFVSDMRDLLESKNFDPDSPTTGVCEKASMFICYTDIVDGYKYSSVTGPYTETGVHMEAGNIAIHTNETATTPLYKMIEIFDEYF